MFLAIYGTPCKPGYSGLFCQPCSMGTFKADFSNYGCINCTNLPSGAEYNGTEADSPFCKYKCKNQKYNSESYDTCISNLLEFSITKGGYIAFNVVIGMTVVLILVGVIRMLHSYHKMKTKSQRAASLRTSFKSYRNSFPG